MELSDIERSAFRTTAHSKLDEKLAEAEDTNDYEEIMSILDINPDTLPKQVQTKKQKILVIGDLAGRKGNYIDEAKDMGIPIKSFDFIDYYEIKNYGINNLSVVGQYKDVICGPIPHSVSGKFHSNNPNSITELRNLGPDVNVITCTKKQRGFHLKITLASFKEALLQTDYYKRYGKKEK